MNALRTPKSVIIFEFHANIVIHSHMSQLSNAKSFRSPTDSGLSVCYDYRIHIHIFMLCVQCTNQTKSVFREVQRDYSKLLHEVYFDIYIFFPVNLLLTMQLTLYMIQYGLTSISYYEESQGGPRGEEDRSI